MSAEHTLGGAVAGPLRIDSVEVPSGGTLGLCHFPGRNGVDGKGRRWTRGLEEDLAAIEAWGATTLLTLVETQEFASLGAPAFVEVVRTRRFEWHHVPIVDMGTPDARTLEAWRRSGPLVLQALRRGERVVVHCAAGLGRSGAIAAKLLVAFGVTPADAITRVRAARPGTLETAGQEAFVHDAASLPLPGGSPR